MWRIAKNVSKYLPGPSGYVNNLFVKILTPQGCLLILVISYTVLRQDVFYIQCSALKEVQIPCVKNVIIFLPKYLTVNRYHVIP